MKSLKKMNFAGAVLLATLMFISCEKEESPEVINEEQTFEVVDLQASDESELITEEIINIGEDVYATDEISLTSRGDYRS